MPEHWRGAACLRGLGDHPCGCSPAPWHVGLAQCCYLCTAAVWEVLSSGWGGFSSAKEGGKEAKGKERKCADGPEQVSCGAASQALLAEVSIPFEWQEQIPGPGHGLGFRGLMPAEAPEPRQGCAGQRGHHSSSLAASSLQCTGLLRAVRSSHCWLVL